MNNSYKYDSALKNLKTDFRSIVKYILTNMFGVDLKHASNIKRIYVDLNSAISVLFRYEDIGDADLITIVSDAIEKFIVANMDEGRSVYILYNLAPSRVHRSICPEWCKERDERVKIVSSDFLKKLLVSLQIFSEKNKLVKVINCSDVHTALVVHTIDKSFSSGALVLSKDEVFKCINKPSICIYNGVEWIDIGVNMFNTESRVFLSNPSNLSSYYFTIRGNKRNEFDGVSGYGPLKTQKYLESNKLKLQAGVDHPLKEHVDKFLPMYDIDLMCEKAKELGMNLDKFKNLAVR